MPITALPPSNTPRWFMDYAVSGVNHTLMMRANDLKTASLVSSVLDGLFQLMDVGNLYTIDTISLRHAAEGSDVTVPETWSGASSYGGGTAFDTDNRVRAYSFTGRSLDGHKCKFFIYGALIGAEGDYRIDTGSNAGISDAIDYLNALNGFFISISGEPVVWNPYANVGWNDHWLKVLRG